MSVAMLLLLAACGDDAVTSVDAGSRERDAVAGANDAGASSDARRLPDATRGRDDPDGNATPADAVPLILGGAPVDGSTSGDQDYDYFTIDAIEGQYVAIVLEVTSGDVFGALLYLALLSPDLALLAESRDMNGCAGIASGTVELVTRVVSAGRHVVELHPLYGSESTWRARAVDLATVPTSLVIGESGTPRVTAEHSCVLGAFEEVGDVDSAELDVELYTAINAFSPGRHGSTGGVSSLEIADGAIVRSRGDLAVVVDSGAALTLRVRGPTTRGANDHYLLLPTAIGRYGPPVFFTEAADAANDVPAGAELIDPPPPDMGGYPPRFVFLIPPGDVDHFAFDAVDSTTMMLSCQGETIGTGVRGLVLELLDSAGAVIATERENRLGMANLSAMVEPGRHVVRFTAESHDASIASDLASCTASLGGM